MCFDEVLDKKGKHLKCFGTARLLAESLWVWFKRKFPKTAHCLIPTEAC